MTNKVTNYVVKPANFKSLCMMSTICLFLLIDARVLSQDLIPGRELTGYVADLEDLHVVKGEGDNILICFGSKSQLDCEDCCREHKFEAYDYPGICGCAQNTKSTHEAAVSSYKKKSDKKKKVNSKRIAQLD